MPEPDSSGEDFGSRLWRNLKSMLTGSDAEPSLRESLEDAIDEHDAETGASDDLSPVERVMLKNMLHFGERTAGDVAVPRADIISFDVEQGFPALVVLFREAGHSRMPVWRGDSDTILGMVHVKDVYAEIAGLLDEPRSAVRLQLLPVEPLLREVLFVPASMRIIDLLARMRAGKTHMAIVIDEYGGTDGLVTIEDLMEEIVGDIEDEHDEDEAALLQAIGGDLWEADARLPLEELEAGTGQRFADAEVGGDVDTLGGMVFMLAGRVPATSEFVDHPSGWRFEVIDGDPRMVRRLRLHPPEAV